MSWLTQHQTIRTALVLLFSKFSVSLPQDHSFGFGPPQLLKSCSASSSASAPTAAASMPLPAPQDQGRTDDGRCNIQHTDLVAMIKTNGFGPVASSMRGFRPSLFTCLWCGCGAVLTGFDHRVEGNHIGHQCHLRMGASASTALSNQSLFFARVCPVCQVEQPKLASSRCLEAPSLGQVPILSLQSSRPPRIARMCACVWTSVTKRTQVFAITQHIS